MSRLVVAIVALIVGAFFGYMGSQAGKPIIGGSAMKQAQASPATHSVAARPSSQAPTGEGLAERTRAMSRVTVDLVPPRTDDELISALRGAFTDPVEHRKNKAFLDLFEYLTPESAVRIVDVFGEFYQRGIQQELAWRTFWTRWGEIDGAGALEFAVNNPKFARSGHLHIEMLMKGWSTVDPDSAERWLRAHPEVPHQGWMAAALAGSWATSDPDRATSMLFSLPLKPDELNQGLGTLAETLRLTGGLEKVGVWFERLDAPVKQLAFSHAAARIKDGDLDYAKDWFALQADKPWRVDSHYLEFIQRYGTKDPAAAAAWVFSIPPNAGESYPIGTSKVMEQWTMKDAPSASSWLMQRRQETWWPRAAKGYFNGLEKRDPTAAEAFMDALAPSEREAIERDLQISK